MRAYRAGKRINMDTDVQLSEKPAVVSSSAAAGLPAVSAASPRHPDAIDPPSLVVTPGVESGSALPSGASPGLSRAGGVALTAGLCPPEKVNLHGVETGREALSHTRLGSLLACPQRYFWRYEKGLEPAVKRVALEMGSAFAHALEVNDPFAGSDMVLARWADAVDENAGNPWIVLPSEEDAEVTATTVRAAARAYLDHFGHADVQREVTMRARLRNPETGAYSKTFDVQARIDGLAGDRLIEDKFVGRVDPVTERRLLLDRQVTIGTYLIWRTTGELIRDVSYRMTKKPSIRRKQGESHNEFLHRLERDYAERPDFYLQEFTLTRGPDDFLRLEAELWDWAESIRRHRRASVFPRNTAACSDFGGCEFIDACVRAPGWESQFVERGEFG